MVGFLEELKLDKKTRLKNKIKAKIASQKCRLPSKRVYILRIGLKGKEHLTYETVYKIGVTGRLVKRRVAEIVDSFENQYGYYPMVEIIRGHDRKHRIQGFESAELELLRMFAYGKIEWLKPFNGSSEFRRCEEEELLKAYDNVIKKYSKI